MVHHRLWRAVTFADAIPNAPADSRCVATSKPRAAVFVAVVDGTGIICRLRTASLYVVGESRALCHAVLLAVACSLTASVHTGRIAAALVGAILRLAIAHAARFTIHITRHITPALVSRRCYCRQCSRIQCSPNARSGTVKGTSTASAIAQLVQNQDAREYNRDMATSFREKILNKTAKIQRLRPLSPVVRNRRFAGFFSDSSRHAETDPPHAAVIEQQIHRPREDTFLPRQLHRHAKGIRLAGQERDGQTARNRTRSVLRPTNEADGVIFSVD